MKVDARDELRLYDIRGTAAKELLRAGCCVYGIAATKGWGLRHAASVIELYAALAPEVADEVHAKQMVRAKAIQEVDASATK